MPKPTLSRNFVKRLSAIRAKRPKRVIDHILKHGFVTTEELRTEYGYAHPPRAARDVRECGIPLETFRVKRKSDGRSIGAYRFGDPTAIRRGLVGGRRAFSKTFKKALVVRSKGRCEVCSQAYNTRYLQIDHRVPYEVAGDVRFVEPELDSYMLVCGSCNRAKSWSCEHCKNWVGMKSVRTCQRCYWGSPESYTHIATLDARRLDLMWLGPETRTYDTLKRRAEVSNESLPSFVKKTLRRLIREQ